MAKTQPVNFKVLDIKEARKQGFVIIRIKFDNNDTEYTYCRKYGRDGLDLFAIISGCKIKFDNNLNFISVEREYDVKGVKRRSTANTRRKYKFKFPEIEEEATETEQKSEEKAEEVEEVKEPEENKEEVEKEVEKEKDEEVKLPKKIRHEEYQTICDCLDADIPIYLVGPAGSGKNYTLEQIARERGWNFYFTNSVQQEYKLTGFIDAGGKYHETEFYKACTDEEECMFFLDELDASIPEVLVLLNAAIANGYFEFPTGKVSLGHVHIVAAGNTVGSGSDDMYTGRMVIDQSTIDRFAIIEFDYSRVIEQKITKGNNELIDFIHDIRDIAKRNGIRAVFSYRCMIMTIALEEKGMDLVKIMKIAIFKGLDKDTINTFTAFGSNKYYSALTSLKLSF